MCALLIHYLFVFEHSPSYDSNLRQDHNRPYARKSLMWDLPFWNDESEKYQTTKRESSKISTWSHSNSCLSFIFLPNIETLLLLLLSSPIESKKRFKVRTFLCLNWSQIHGVFYELTFFFFFFGFLEAWIWWVGLYSILVKWVCIRFAYFSFYNYCLVHFA